MSLTPRTSCTIVRAPAGSCPVEPAPKMNGFTILRKACPTSMEPATGQALSKANRSQTCPRVE